jgi:hypothetical protein
LAGIILMGGVWALDGTLVGIMDGGADGRITILIGVGMTHGDGTILGHGVVDGTIGTARDGDGMVDGDVITGAGETIVITIGDIMDL